MKILGIIPARGGSKGIRNKNIKPLCGKPLIQYTIESALKSKLLTRISVSSDSDAIIKFASGFPVDVPYKRPKYLGKDNTPMIDVVVHLLKHYKKNGEKFDAVCLLQPTYPLRSGEMIDKAIQIYRNKNADALISVLEVPHHFNPHWTFERNKHGQLKSTTGESSIITRRQDLPVSYHRDGAIYITNSKIVLNQNSLFGNKLTHILYSDKTYINIDTIEDWKAAEIKISSMK